MMVIFTSFKNEDGNSDVGDDDDCRLGATNVGGEYPSSSKVQLLKLLAFRKTAFSE